MSEGTQLLILSKADAKRIAKQLEDEPDYIKLNAPALGAWLSRAYFGLQRGRPIICFEEADKEAKRDLENLLDVFGVHGKVKQVVKTKPQKRKPWVLWIRDPADVKRLLTIGAHWISKKARLRRVLAACDRMLGEQV